MDGDHRGPADTTPPTGAPPGDDAWHDVGERLGDIGDRLREHYRRLGGEEPSDAEFRQAFRVLGSAFQRLMESFGSAFNDPETRESVKRAASSFASALSVTIGELGDELKRAMRPRGEDETAATEERPTEETTDETAPTS